MHFVVTGGAGFIGSHLTEELLKQGHEVTVVDNLSTGSSNNLPQHPHLKFIEKDISSCLADDFAGKVDGIAHLAASPSVTESWLHPYRIHNNNLSATVAVIELCEALKIPRLVFASSAAIYGNQSSPIIHEDLPKNPLSPYGLQKLVSEQYAELFCQKTGFSFVGLRLFNVFGPRQLPNSQYSGVISIFSSAMQQGLPIHIYGDGKQTRDFVFVKDVASAFAKALMVDLAAGTSISCNIGTNKSTSILQLVDVLNSLLPNWQGGTQFSPSRAGDIQDSLADIHKAQSLLDFIPQYSLSSGLSLLLDSLKH
ncbi:NAD-dependent epimerase/dehydratase family protein [Calothrix sp. UHCC 0171]|uniref:NAD-dependent epimerase/dehydratase family protein n=1 Tax=Calothrix sp. UHCC 0171 TaxID=3110245 RepID=UPI002B210055|nr:NAD-dependent epimerase/dehydratase family protein [Calothrix sp. UHCC 0171]MEA5574137.1 NAD-dependent epimerase/dehydratase family protein [Calothrix sp. UHCC 0171]